MTKPATNTDPVCLYCGEATDGLKYCDHTCSTRHYAEIRRKHASRGQLEEAAEIARYKEAKWQDHEAGKPANATPKPSHISNRRDCKHVSGWCLETAIMSKWSGFSCTGCRGYVKANAERADPWRGYTIDADDLSRKWR